MEKANIAYSYSGLVPEPSRFYFDPVLEFRRHKERERGSNNTRKLTQSQKREWERGPCKEALAVRGSCLIFQFFVSSYDYCRYGTSILIDWREIKQVLDSDYDVLCLLLLLFGYQVHGGQRIYISYALLKVS